MLADLPDFLSVIFRGLLMAGVMIFVDWVWTAFTGKPLIPRRNFQVVPLRAWVIGSCLFPIAALIGFLTKQYITASFFAMAALIYLGGWVRHALRRKRGA